MNTTTANRPDPFAGVRSITESNNVFEDTFAAWDDLGDADALRELHRKCMDRIAHGPTEATPRSERRRVSHDATPVRTEDGTLTIVCAACNEEKPVNKFPTKSGRPGVRDNRCRPCVKAKRQPQEVSA